MDVPHPSQPLIGRAADDRDRAVPRTGAPRPRGPVLMGDLTGAWGGRPLLLFHFDQDETSGKVTASAQPR